MTNATINRIRRLLCKSNFDVEYINEQNYDEWGIDYADEDCSCPFWNKRDAGYYVVNDDISEAIAGPFSFHMALKQAIRRMKEWR